MKIRNGFVSNSSSSSYIIALRNNNKPCPHCGRKDPNLLDMIESSSMHTDDNHNNYIGAKDVMENSLNYISEEERKEIIEKIKAYNEEWIIADISVSYHDEVIRTVLNNLEQSGNMKILHFND